MLISQSVSVSVIIPTRNSEKHLGSLIHSVEAQSPEPLEIIIVDNNSSDRTRQLAEDAGVQFLTKGPERSAQRNLGAMQARGEYLLFLDSDMELLQGCIAECIARARSGVQAVVIPERTVGEGLLCDVRQWERALIQSNLSLMSARFISADLFRRVGGYDERITGFEDLDLQATLLECGIRIVATTLPILHHEGSLRTREYLAKRRYYNKSSQLYRVKHPSIAREVFSARRRLSMYIDGIRKPRDALMALGAISLRLAEIGTPALQ